MKSTKIAIIGTGSVGATTAYACMMRNIAAEIMLVDIDEAKCKGEVFDLSDALSFSATSKVEQANFAQAAQADIIIITAGKPQLPGQKRTELLETNSKVLKSIAEKLGDINQKSIVIVVSNPVDALTWYAQQIIRLPKNQIIGSGTMLDSQRLRNLIAQKINIAEQSIHVYILGEHGDQQLAALSAGNIAGVPLDKFIPLTELKKMAQQTIKKAYDIIELKKFTCYGVASSVAALCENIIFDNNRVMPTSCYIKEYDLCMSMPTAIGASGIKEIIKPPLSSEEEDALKSSIKSIKANIAILKKSI
jgi:L-lactate dehydrogenase